MNHWYSESDDEYELEQQENTPEELEVIYSIIDSMIDYIVKRYLDNRTYAFQEYTTHHYIREYYVFSDNILLCNDV